MKPLFLCLFLLPGFFASAGAETVTIGTAVITYEEPQGFVRADALFPLQLDELDAEFGMRTVVFAQYVPAGYPETRAKDPEALPDWYVHFTYDDIFSRLSMGQIGFVITTTLVSMVISHEYGKDDFKRKLGDVFSHAIGRKVTVERITQKGFVEKKAGTRSMLAMGSAMIEGESGDLVLSIATMTTFTLDQGKLIAAIQIGRVNPDSGEADLIEFTRQALERVPQIFPASSRTRNQ
jgi:hypothetical protein